MEQYGPTLRDIRIHKGYTLKQLAKGILSVSFLSKFERGESDISLSHFVLLLDRLAVSFDEFFYLHYDGEWETFDTFFVEAEDAFVNRDLKRIRKLRDKHYGTWKTERMEQYLCNSLMLDIYESILRNETISPEDIAITTLYEYLFHVEVWGNYELRLYNSTMLLMPLEMVLVLSKTAFEKGYKYRGMRESESILTRIMMNTVVFLTGGQNEFNYEEEVEQFLHYIEKLDIPENDLYARNSFLQIKGIFEIRKGNVEKGRNMVKKASTIAKQLGAHQLAKQMDNYLEIVLKKHKT